MGGVALIIPVINEGETTAAVVCDVPRGIVDVVIVVHGGVHSDRRFVGALKLRKTPLTPLRGQLFRRSRVH
jgi:hypothetical protein